MRAAEAERAGEDSGTEAVRAEVDSGAGTGSAEEGWAAECGGGLGGGGGDTAVMRAEVRGAVFFVSKLQLARPTLRVRRRHGAQRRRGGHRRDRGGALAVDAAH